MTRVKRGETAHRRRHKLVKAAKGYRGLRSKTFKQAKLSRNEANIHAYNDRRHKKRSFRRLWITRINAACRPLGIKYSRLVDGMTKKGILINRKMLSELAISEPDAFKAIVEAAK
jgi:large subunit ribosomal protein L20